MRLACLDLGTNSLLLTVADWDSQLLTPVHEGVLLIRLGQNLHAGKKLHPDARSRCIKALEKTREIIRDYRAETVLAVGTEALRKASDGRAFIREINNRLGLSFRIISAREEARLTFKAIQKEFSHLQSSLVAFDIGGGSTEIIAGDALTMTSATTLDLGTVSLTEQFIHRDPIDPGEMEEAARWIHARLDVLSPGPSPQVGVGVGGTVTTLQAARLGMDPYDSSVIHHSTLTRSQVDDMLHLFLSLTVRERAGLKGVPPERADIIPVGAVITAGIMDRLKLSGISVSDRGLRWGVLYDWAERKG